MGERKDGSTERLSPDAAATARAGTRGPSQRVLLLVHRGGVELVRLDVDRPIVVGRDAPCDVALEDSSLSRRHARFVLDPEGTVTVEDLGSTNGTCVAGRTVTRATVGTGEEVLLGGVVAAVHAFSTASGLRGVEGHEAFRAAVDREIVRARYLGRHFSLVMVHAAPHARAHLQHWCERAQAQLRPIDHVGLYSAEALEILLPEKGLAEAAELGDAIVRAAAGTPSLACGVAGYPDSATSAEELFEVAWRAARRATRTEPVRVADPGGSRALAPSRGGSDDEPTFASPMMRDRMRTATKLARGTIPVLLRGETGTGKEVVARFIHERGPRRASPMICVNCAAIPAQLVESTLFGHERGSFTGAAQQQKGVFESARGGTVLLDEIAELPPPAQAALLRVLETKRITRVGSSKEIAVDVRVIAATHRDLEAMVVEGTFRQDLLYRLNAMTLELPPLRDRPEDVAPLVERFLVRAREADDGRARTVDPDAMSLLEAHAWPGNVRELKNAIDRAVVIAHGDTITALDLPERLRDAASTSQPGLPSDGQPMESLDFRSRMDRLEAELLAQALQQNGWNQTLTARRLQMPLRTLAYKLKVHGIRRPVDRRR